MNCDCIEAKKKIALERAKEMKKFKDLEPLVANSNTAFIFGDKGQVSLMSYTEIEVKADYKTASGKFRTKKETFNFVHKYCPFCGKELKED